MIDPLELASFTWACISNPECEAPRLILCDRLGDDSDPREEWLRAAMALVPGNGLIDPGHPKCVHRLRILASAYVFSPNVWSWIPLACKPWVVSLQLWGCGLVGPEVVEETSTELCVDLFEMDFGQTDESVYEIADEAVNSVAWHACQGLSWPSPSSRSWLEASAAERKVQMGLRQAVSNMDLPAMVYPNVQTE